MAAVALAKMYPDATVLTIEPSGENFEILKRNVVEHKKSIWSESTKQMSLDEVFRKVKQEGYTQFGWGGPFLENKKYIQFIIGKVAPSGMILNCSTFYDKQTGKVYEAANSLNSPSLKHSNNTPLFVDDQFYTYPISIWGEYFIAVCDPYQIKLSYEASLRAGRNVKIRDSHLTQILTETTPNSNPMLVLYKFK